MRASRCDGSAAVRVGSRAAGEQRCTSSASDPIYNERARQRESREWASDSATCSPLWHRTYYATIHFIPCVVQTNFSNDIGHPLVPIRRERAVRSAEDRVDSDVVGYVYVSREK